VYSVRMRAAQGGRHEEGGRHISGAERVVPEERVEETTSAMLQRAFSHTRGQADFVNIIVEKIANSAIKQVPLLTVSTAKAYRVEEGLYVAEKALVAAGVSLTGAKEGIHMLQSLSDSMRGAMLLCAVTGRRLDNTGGKGIRVSRMDIEKEEVFKGNLVEQGIDNMHVREALVLASKVAAGPGIVAELCWSDDPEYTTGYVACPRGYLRIPHCKPLGNGIGGRVFFINPNTDLLALKEYLQHQPVLVKI